jgi:hypothetical protein
MMFFDLLQLVPPAFFSRDFPGNSLLSSRLSSSTRTKVRVEEDKREERNRGTTEWALPAARRDERKGLRRARSDQELRSRAFDAAVAAACTSAR